MGNYKMTMLAGNLTIILKDNGTEYYFDKIKDNFQSISFPTLLLFTKETDKSNNARMCFIQNEIKAEECKKKFQNTYPYLYVFENSNSFTEKQLKRIESEFEKTKE